MAAVAKNPAFAKKVGIKKSVGEEFLQADKGKKFKGGGMMDKKDIKQDKAMAKKAVGMHEKQLHGGKKSDLAALKKGGMAKKMAVGGPATASQVKAGKQAAAIAIGKRMNAPLVTGPSKNTIVSDSDVAKAIGTRWGMGRPKVMKKGGMAKGGCYARGGGIEKKGKTKGRII